MTTISMITAARLVEEHTVELNNPIYNMHPKCKAYSERCIADFTAQLNAFEPNWKAEYEAFKASCR